MQESCCGLHRPWRQTQPQITGGKGATFGRALTSVSAAVPPEVVTNPASSDWSADSHKRAGVCPQPRRQPQELSGSSERKKARQGPLKAPSFPCRACAIAGKRGRRTIEVRQENIGRPLRESNWDKYNARTKPALTTQICRRSADVQERPDDSRQRRQSTQIHPMRESRIRELLARDVLVRFVCLFN